MRWQLNIKSNFVLVVFEREHLAAQLLARVDVERPGHMLPAGQGQQQVAGDEAGALGAARRGGGARRARRAETLLGAAGALGEPRALGRGGVLAGAVLQQQPLGGGAPAAGGRQQESRAAGLRLAAHGDGEAGGAPSRAGGARRRAASQRAGARPEYIEGGEAPTAGPRGGRRELLLLLQGRAPRRVPQSRAGQVGASRLRLGVCVCAASAASPGCALPA